MAVRNDDLMFDDLSARPLANEVGMRSAVSWGAILAGAVAAAVLSLILLLLGVGLGFSAVSPWATEGIDASTLGLSTIAWISFTQIMAGGLGGYLAGRLRTKWTAVHGDEVFFRDTAHGFLAWAVATLGTAVLLSSMIGSIVTGGMQAGASVAGGLAKTAGTAALGGATAVASTADADDAEGPFAYFIDTLFRGDARASSPQTSTSYGQVVPAENLAADMERSLPPAGEVGRIFMAALRTNSALPADDARYVGQLVAEHTGLSEAEATSRVNDTYTRLQATIQETETTAREMADTAREAGAYSTLWMFVSLLIGAFFASLMATFGGRQRDL